MKTMLVLLLALSLSLSTACDPDNDPPAPGNEIPAPQPTPDPDPDPEPEPEPSTAGRLSVRIGGETFTAALSDNDAARALAGLLPLRVRMEELNGNEKFTYLPDPLPAAASRPGTIRAGDLMLFGSDCLVLFYRTFQTLYSYTPLGRLDDPSGLEAALGRGSVAVSFERLSAQPDEPAGK